MSKESFRFYRSFSKTSVGGLEAGLSHGGPLSKTERLSEFARHRYLGNREPTALVSVSDRPIEALHRAFSKYYNNGEKPEDIWVVIISVPLGKDYILPHRAEHLASDDKSGRFRHEHVFERKIPNLYVEHMVSLKTLLNRGLDLETHLQGSFLPELQEFRCSMVNMILSKPMDGYSVGRELGHMAKCFGARAPVKTIAHGLLTNCPTWISYNKNSQWVKWEWKIDANVYTSECFDSEHLYWISQGISDVLFDCWLADGDFIEDCITHNELVNDLTAELEILREIYFERIIDYPGSAAEDAFELERRENEFHDIIERHAVSIGL